jgi:polar amino acid transport system substrate-binding protein
VTGLRRTGWLLVLVILLGTGCSINHFPADTEGTLERASGGVLRVGISEHPPWTRVADDGSVTGSEADILRGYATSIGARINWTSGAESHLIQQLEEGGLDVVIGGLSSDLPWQKQAAFTRPYAKSPAPDGSTRKMVFATRLGENALLGSLERYLIDRGLEP